VLFDRVGYTNEKRDRIIPSKFFPFIRFPLIQTISANYSTLSSTLPWYFIHPNQSRSTEQRHTLFRSIAKALDFIFSLFLTFFLPPFREDALLWGFNSHVTWILERNFRHLFWKIGGWIYLTELDSCIFSGIGKFLSLCLGFLFLIFVEKLVSSGGFGNHVLEGTWKGE